MHPSEFLSTRLDQAIGETGRLLEAVERQRRAEGVRETPPMHDFVIELERVLRSYREALVEQRSAWSGPSAGVKQAVQDAVNTVAGLFESLKGEPLVDLLRRDYAALSHTYFTARLLSDRIRSEGMEPLEHLAEEHVDALASLLRRAEGILPSTVPDAVPDGAPSSR